MTVTAYPRIPFHRPTNAGRELDYMREAIAGRRLAGNGSFTWRCQDLLQQILGAPKALLTTSCTHALEMAALLLDVGPGDEVIAPSFTFSSTLNAFVLRGARPVFVDVRPDTLNLDETRLEALITDRTRAILVVHYAGVACEMDRILEVAARRGVAVVEDNAHGLFGSYRGRPLGTFGVMSTLSFHETKNLTCGEGGALVMNDASLVERAEILREKGTNRTRFSRGEVPRYTWVDIGSSYLPSEILAAFLCAQLEARERIQAQRQAIWSRYAGELRHWADLNGVTLPTVPGDCDHPAHLFYLLLPSSGHREAFLRHLNDRGVEAAFHYVPLHLSEMGQRFGAARGDCPVAEDASARLARLPLSTDATAAEQDQVVTAIRQFQC
jgi:dTDP-4-amino-4,6-dideoxygalactose transaminase